MALEGRLRALYGVAGWPVPLTSSRVEVRPAVVYLRDGGDVAPRLDATATLDRLDLVKPRYSGSVEGSFSYLAQEAFTSYGPRVRLSLRSRTFANILQASVGWQLGVVKYTSVSSVIEMIPGLEEDLGLKRVDRIGAYDQSVVIDLRDSRVSPRNGGYVELRAEEGTRAAGGELSYLRLVPEARGYLGLGPIVAAGRARVGALLGKVSATRRFFAGGANSQRGFPERHLAPFAAGPDKDGEFKRVPYGGSAMLELSGELRFPSPLKWWLFRRLGGVIFLDGGDVTEDWDGLDAGHLHWALGGGVRLPTVIGAVRFDFGYRITRTGAGEPRPDDNYAFHLSVGEAF